MTKIVRIVLKLKNLVIYIADYSRISLISEMLVIGLKAHSHYHNGYVITKRNDTNGA